MNILIEPGTYDCLNMGDVAMLEVTIARLSSLWPSAAIHVLTRQPQALRAYFPTVQPVPEQGRQTWFADKNLLGRLHQSLPAPFSERLADLKRSVRETSPALLSAVTRIRLVASGTSRKELDLFFRAMNSADLFVVSGQGTLTDRSESHAIRLLDTLEMAIRRGIPTAMFGQGLGPITDPKLFARARAVLPLVDLIAIREDVAAPSLLAALGVDPMHVFVTGDDAIETVLEARGEDLGTGIGVNVRLTAGTGVNAALLRSIRRVVQAFAREHDAPLVPVPIAFHTVARDPENIMQILSGYDDLSDGGQSLTNHRQIIRQAGKCRIVVTVAYHAAVFALAQGIPVVCLAQTQYYIDKFVGLKALFGAGCEIVLLDHDDLEGELAEAMARSWEAAGALKLPLLTAAERQVNMGRDAYSAFGELAGYTVTQPYKVLDTTVAAGAFRLREPLEVGTHE